MGIEVEIVKTKPFEGQKPGTSGLRKPVTVFQQEHYLENFTQCVLDAGLEGRKNGTLVIGGDGRYFSPEAIKTIIKICAANNVRHLLVGQNGIMSTPAVSCVIRLNKASGGIILTASHNPGGPDGDFGIKFNIANGGPAPDGITSKMYSLSQQISEYRLCHKIEIDLDKIGTQEFSINSNDAIDGSTTSKFTISIIDSVKDYSTYMEDIFDFSMIRKLLVGKDGKRFEILLDCMHGVVGPYAKNIFCDKLGMPQNVVVNSEPLPDFGGGHPDPNLTYAAELVNRMKESSYELGAAFDGDGDRNMILGANAFFVTPSDSLAVIGANLECIPYFQKFGVKGYARSMPTSLAIDQVAKLSGKDIYEVPTGWKYFGNLMDAGKLSLCGEESFGTGSDHIREKDGLWAVLAWLSILAYKNKTVEELLKEHWKTYGRNYFVRYDYENCDAGPCQKMMTELEAFVVAPNYVGTSYECANKKYTVSIGDNFQYTDPVDGSVAVKQGIRIIFEDGSRLVFRLSGTGSVGATVRVYIESYESDTDKLFADSCEALAPLVNLALKIAKIKEYTGREKPTVIT